jgi:hypothetical protein
MIPAGETLPYLVKQCKESLNQLCHIERTPGKNEGAQVNFYDALRKAIQKHLSSLFDNLLSMFCLCVIVQFGILKYNYGEKILPAILFHFLIDENLHSQWYKSSSKISYQTKWRWC